VASRVFGPATTQVDPDLPDRESRQTTNWHHTDDPGSLHLYGQLSRSDTGRLNLFFRQVQLNYTVTKKPGPFFI